MPARDYAGVLGMLDWTPIVVALITLSGVVLTALLNLYVVRQIRTPSGTSIGKQVEDVNHTTRVTHHRVEASAKRDAARDARDVDSRTG